MEFDKYDVTSRLEDYFHKSRPSSFSELKEVFNSILKDFKSIQNETKNVINFAKSLKLSVEAINYNEITLYYKGFPIHIDKRHLHAHGEHWYVRCDKICYGNEFTSDELKNQLIVLILIIDIFIKIPTKYRLLKHIKNTEIETDKISISYKEEEKKFNICDPNLESNIISWIGSIYDSSTLIKRIQKLSAKIKKYKTIASVQKAISKLDTLIGTN